MPLPLTDREREIATLISQGLSNIQIAEALTLSYAPSKATSTEPARGWVHPPEPNSPGSSLRVTTASPPADNGRTTDSHFNNQQRGTLARAPTTSASQDCGAAGLPSQ